MFADIVGFTEFAENHSAEELVKVLNEIFARYDAQARMNGVEKVKTIGDAYMAVSGVPRPDKDHVKKIVNMALDIRETTKRFRSISGLNIEVRIGIHTGPLIAGIIGRYKFLYDLWGDTVNTAARMESHGEVGAIQITEEVKKVIEGQYKIKSRGEIDIKSKGKMKVYIVENPLITSVGK